MSFLWRAPSSFLLAAESVKPNVVLILIDDLGRNDLGCYGSKYYKTPHLDKLAAEGMKFQDAYAACPVCSPTRASIMTGKYPARLHLTDWLPGRGDRPDQKLNRPKIRQELPLDEITLAEALKAAGYVTASMGKWHLGGQGYGPQQQGFDVNIGGDQSGTPYSYIAPFTNRAGKTIVGLEQAPPGEYLTDRLALEAEKFIDAHHDKPFFLYLPHYTVHTPLVARPDVKAKYKNELKLGEQSNPIYAAMIESMDDAVGRVLARLAQHKIDQRTIVLFTSDNGGLCVVEGPNTPATINSPHREGKGYLYEGGIRVPLLIKAPGVTKPGSTSSVPVSSVDFFPTLLELCGVKTNHAIDGVSLAAVLKGDEQLSREALYWHYPHYSNQGGKPGAAIRMGDYKLIEFYETGRRELFNVKTDFREIQNLIAQQPKIAEQLAEKLDQWRRAVGAQMMEPNPQYVPHPQDAQGVVTLPAKNADVQGITLRYEPLPHKNTLGFWTRKEDTASWEFTIKTPGKFQVEILQGCGKGHGGSEVAFTFGDQVLKTTIVDTGHFQNFQPREIGTVHFDKPGRYTLRVAPQTKPGGAVMDLRQVTLKPIAGK